MENIQDIDIKRLEVNKGQVEGLPKNPRFIRDERYKALVKSIEDAPEMLKLRELLVVEHGNKFVVIGGNMRRWSPSTSRPRTPATRAPIFQPLTTPGATRFPAREA